MTRTLPAGFTWETVSQYARERNALVFNFIRVATISERVDGAGWAVTVHKQRQDYTAQPWAIAKDEAQARRWVITWAVRDEAMIRAEVAAYNARLKR
jgi:hypothetical protein